MRILFVCLGNICRSPTAEGVMRSIVAEAGFDGQVEIESAGTGDWHVGEGPDRRSFAAAAERGYELGGAARQVRPSDFEEFDLVVAMDRQNHRDLIAIAPHATGRMRLLREYGDGEFGGGPRDDHDLDVPDPYHGGPDGFSEVLDIVEHCCEALLDEITAELEARGTGRAGG